MKRLLAVLILLAAGSTARAQQRAPAEPTSQLAGQSTFRLVAPSASCSFGYRAVNVRYTVVGSTVAARSGLPHLVLEERTVVEQCENLEGPTTAEVSVVARPAARPQARPAWLVRRRGEVGAVVDDFPGEPIYRITTWGCCASENLDSYYSLANGRLLFTADHPLLFVDAEPFGTGLVAVHDVQAADAPPGADTDRTLIATVAFGSTTRPAQRVLLRGPSSAFAIYKLELLARGPGGRETHAQTLGGGDRLGAGWTVWVAMEIEAITGGDATARVEIPIENGRMVIEKARVPAPFRLGAALAR